MRRASNPDEFKLKVAGVQFTADIAREEMEGTLEMPGESDLMGEDSPFEVEREG
jgi:hypothetical protein